MGIQVIRNRKIAKLHHLKKKTKPIVNDLQEKFLWMCYNNPIRGDDVMGFIDEKYDEFVNSKDFEEIGNQNSEIQQLIMMLHFKINEFGITSYPVFREKDKSIRGLKVFNLKIKYPSKKDAWDNAVTVKPYQTMIELFTSKNGEPQKSYFMEPNDINVCKYKNKTVPIEKLLKEIKEIDDIRTNSCE